ncbi:MAG: hypothetical protein CMC63_09670 [Flavobacteriaceae bacterium]|nr:hypothetical protein [Flavobacteriaceae bacterium]
MKKNSGYYFRIIHRYLGFYLVGIMAVYSISGITLIFRKTDTFKKVTEIRTKLDPKLDRLALGKTLKINNLKFSKTEKGIRYFKEGQYNMYTGETIYLKKELPYLLKKMQSLHKATTKSPVYWLNIFFGSSLMFFVVSSFWMFLPNTTVFKKGILFSIAGIIMTIVILFI